MEGGKLLNLSLQRLLFRGFLRFLFLFTILYVLGAKKHTLLQPVSFAKKTPSLTGRKRRKLLRKEGNYSLFVISWTYIIH